MRKRQHEVFRKGIPQTEGQLPLVVLTVDGVLFHVIERVVHPAHIPLIAKPKAPGIDRPRHLGPGRGLLGYGLYVGIMPVYGLIELPHELDRLLILAAPLGIGHPLPRGARIIAIEHGCHAIDPQTVHVKPVEPVKRARDEDRTHLVTAIVEHARAPFRMVAAAWVGMLEKMRPVEKPKPVTIRWKMRRHPIEDHSNTLAMQGVDEMHEILGRTETRGGREISRGLIAPRTIEGVFGKRHEFDMRKPHVGDIGRQRQGQLAVTEPTPALLRHPPPGTGMHLVDAHRRGQRNPLTALRHPRRILPRIRTVAHHRGRARRQFAPKRERIGLLHFIAGIARDDVVFIEGTGADPGDKARPQTRPVVADLERMGLLAPTVKIADHRHRPGIGCPHGEMHACIRRHAQRMRAELLVEPRMPPFAEEVNILRTEPGIHTADRRLAPRAPAAWHALFSLAEHRVPKTRGPKPTS